MIVQNKSLLICILIAIQISVLSADTAQKKFVIGAFGKGAGFFALFIGVLNNLIWCDNNDRAPVVVWDHECVYYQEDGYNGIVNAWEYYFEPVSNSFYETSDGIYRNYWAPDGSGIDYTSFLYVTMINSRYFAHYMIKKYVKVKPSIIEKVDDFYYKYIAGKKTIGIHLRGTDKWNEVPQVASSIIFTEANKYVSEGYQFFIATDDQTLLSRAKENLQGPIISYDSLRSDNGQALHASHPEKARVGEEVLIEVLLLARCDKFLHTGSNVGTAVYYFNPHMPGTLFYADRDPCVIEPLTRCD